jgi:WD40 repeat protein
MTRNADVLERLAPLSGAPSRGYEDLLRLRTKRQRARKIGAIAVVTALLVALVGLGIGTLDDRTEKPANPPDGSHAGTFTGMVIRYTGDPYEAGGDLVAQDPSTGEVTTVVECCASAGLRQHGIGWAAPSADGRWVAFQELSGCVDRASGLWVANGTDEPRLLTGRCLVNPASADGTWAWSPVSSQLAAVEGGQLVLLDAATGDRTELGEPAGDVTSLAWSPDGAQVAYATVPFGSPDGISPDGSVYVVSVDGGEHSLIAESIGQVPGGEEGSGIQWSPDGRRIAILAEPDPDADPRGTLYAMNADGSNRRSLAEAVLVAHTQGSPNVVWSPDGSRIAYATFNRNEATFSRGHDKVQVWSASADGSTPVLVFSPTSDPPEDTDSGGPIWSPDGKRIAFRYDTHSLQRSYLIANADGTGAVQEIDELRYQGLRGGWYFCECYG